MNLNSVIITLVICTTICTVIGIILNYRRKMMDQLLNANPENVKAAQQFIIKTKENKFMLDFSMLMAKFFRLFQSKIAKALKD